MLKKHTYDKNRFKVAFNPKPHQPPFLLLDFGDMIDPVYAFLNELFARGFSKTTIRAYAFDLLAFYRFLAEHNLKLELLNHQHFIDFILAHRRQNAAPRTINRRLIVVRNFLNTQYDDFGDQLLKQYSSAFYKGRRNKALLGPTRIKDKKQKSLSVKVPTLILTPLRESEIKKFLSGIRKYRDQAIIYLMLFCGLRSFEVLNLELDDVDFIDNQIRVKGKGLKQRMLPMPRSVRQTLDHYINYERPLECKHNRVITVLQGPHRGQPLKREGLRMLFRHRRFATSLPRVHPHLFRHTFCTSLISQGVSLPVVQKLMGHSDIEVTMLYVHTSMDDVAKEYHKAISELQKPYDKENTE
ncbi:MAG: tyrosine-type recombinase/integrase [bacterium]|nr:tyrosine-type recombinase/integrase [bacterium]MBU1917631.1 tyrosine-type recombinase/integrase [bacterium]